MTAFKPLIHRCKQKYVIRTHARTHINPVQNLWSARDDTF